MGSPRRRAAATASGLVALAVVAGPALAAWDVTATAPTMTAKASALGTVGSLAATVTSTSVTLTWTTPSGVPPTGYTVSRTAPSSSTVCSNILLLTCTDTGRSSGTIYTYSVVALRNSWTGPATTLQVVTTPIFVITPSVSAVAAGTSFTVTLTAKTSAGTTDTSYDGNKTITWGGLSTSPGGDSPSYPSSTVNFLDGVSTATLTLTARAAGVNTLTVSAGSPTRGGTVPISVTSGAPAGLAFTSVLANGSPDSCSSTIDVGDSGGTVVAKVSVVDAFDNPTTTATARNVTGTATNSSDWSLTLTPSPLVIPAGAAESTGTLTVLHLNNHNQTTTVSVASTPLTAATCTVDN